MSKRELPLRPIPLGGEASVGDHQRYPGCRFTITCSLCGWTKGYNPERVIHRLRELKAGGQATPLHRVGARVAWPCPGCGRVKWRAGLGWPADLRPDEVRRLANRYRN